LVGEQGLLALVEEEDGMVGLVDAAEGFVRVVCPNVEPEINERAAVTAKITRMFTRSLPIQEDSIPTMLQYLSFDNQARQFLEPSLNGWSAYLAQAGFADVLDDAFVAGFLACLRPTDFADPKTAEEASGASLSCRIANFG
jgi:hypothetical protein